MYVETIYPDVCPECGADCNDCITTEPQTTSQCTYCTEFCIYKDESSFWSYLNDT